MVAKIGEKISIRRFTRYEGVVDTYIHLGGRIGVLVDLDAPASLKDNAELKAGCARHRDAHRGRSPDLPQAVRKSPRTKLEHEKEINRNMALNEDKAQARRRHRKDARRPH